MKVYNNFNVSVYLVYQCIGLVTESGRLTVTMPNKLNVAFDFSSFLKLYLAATSIGKYLFSKYDVQFLVFMPYELPFHSTDEKRKPLVNILKFAPILCD